MDAQTMDHGQQMDAQTMDHKRVEALAYQLWEERGRPIGTPDNDWLAAEQILLG